MACESCAFETERLAVSPWHASARTEEEIARTVAALLSESVTRSLPPAWQGPYSIGRAAAWIAERDAEGPTLLVADKATGEAVGLLVLFESGVADGVDVRLGYVLAESAWGRGLGSELVDGFVRWCRERAEIRSLAGGVAADNPASARILEKNGFVPVGHGEGPEAEQIFELRLRP